MSSISKVKQSIVLTTSGQLQKLNTSSGAAINITKAQIMTVYGMSSNTDAEIKIYNEIGSSATAKKLIFHGKFGSAANAVQEFKLPGIGIYADTGCYVVLTNCDFCYVAGTF
jgi:hypothetical protein|tara:strand:+ start:489 stop:824 length:336 start_codon:yes stop_codon:yes gene_type:complete